MLHDLQKALKSELRAQVTVWDPDDESKEYTFNSHILEVSGLLLQIAGPAEDMEHIAPLLRKGYVVGIVLESYPLPFIFYPIIMEDFQAGSPGVQVHIPPDGDIEVLQQRTHVRIAMVMDIEVEFNSLDSAQVQAARTENMSGGGLRFSSSRLFSAEERLTIHIQLDEDEPRMHLPVQVIFSRENRIRKHPDDIYTTACKFIDLDSAEEMKIVRECFRRELRLKKKH